MIEAHELCKRFGAFQAVRDLTLTIRPGELLALLGPNGAGKTTTVRMLGAILKPTSGWARVNGYDVVRDAQAARSNIGLLTEYPGLYSRMRAVEYLDFFGALQHMHPVDARMRVEKLLKQFDLWEARDKRLDSYSKGMRQKIALVRALIHDPPVLFLDEPTTAMDPQSARVVRDAIGELRATERSILLTTHNLAEAEALADRIAIICGGQIIAEGAFEQLTRQLLGDPVWEVRVAPSHQAAAVVPLLDGLAHVEYVDATVSRYRCAEPHLVNPRIVRRLLDHHLPVVAITEVQRSLEDVYLRIVAEQEALDSEHHARAAASTSGARREAEGVA